MVPQNIKPALQRTAIEVSPALGRGAGGSLALSLPAPAFPRALGLSSHSPHSVSPDPGMGPAEHEELPPGQCLLPQPRGGVWGPDGAVLCHQEPPEEPQLRRLHPLHGSGEPDLPPVPFQSPCAWNFLRAPSSLGVCSDSLWDPGEVMGCLPPHLSPKTGGGKDSRSPHWESGSLGAAPVGPACSFLPRSQVHRNPQDPSVSVLPSRAGLSLQSPPQGF